MSEYKYPQYTAIVVTSNGTRHYIKTTNNGLTENIVLSESESQMAQKVEITLANLREKDTKGSTPYSLFKMRDRVYVYARNYGASKSTEVFRGYIWEKKYSSKNNVLTLICYDRLIYFMQSEICKFYSKGKYTKDIFRSICKSKGIKLSYTYSSIKHPKLPLKGSLANVLTSDLLDEVKKKKGKDYVVKAQKGVIYVQPVGSNSTVYHLKKNGGGAIEAGTRSTMDSMVTKVVITGKTNKAGKTAIAATKSKNTKRYGTLTKLISKDEDTKLSEAKQEANYILKNNAQPETTYDITAVDIPWIKKGHKVRITAGSLSNTTCIVKSITHDAQAGTLSMECVKAPSSSSSSSGSTSYKVGDKVKISKVYYTSVSTTALNPLIKTGYIVRIIAGRNNPYLIATRKGGSSWIGWTRKSYMSKA